MGKANKLRARLSLNRRRKNSLTGSKSTRVQISLEGQTVKQFIESHPEMFFNNASPKSTCVDWHRSDNGGQTEFASLSRAERFASGLWGEDFGNTTPEPICGFLSEHTAGDPRKIAFLFDYANQTNAGKCMLSAATGAVTARLQELGLMESYFPRTDGFRHYFSSDPLRFYEAVKLGLYSYDEQVKSDISSQTGVAGDEGQKLQPKAQIIMLLGAQLKPDRGWFIAEKTEYRSELAPESEDPDGVFISLHESAPAREWFGCKSVQEFLNIDVVQKHPGCKKRDEEQKEPVLYAPEVVTFLERSFLTQDQLLSSCLTAQQQLLLQLHYHSRAFLQEFYYLDGPLYQALDESRKLAKNSNRSDAEVLDRWHGWFDRERVDFSRYCKGVVNAETTQEHGECERAVSSYIKAHRWGKVRSWIKLVEQLDKYHAALFAPSLLNEKKTDEEFSTELSKLKSLRRSLVKRNHFGFSSRSKRFARQKVKQYIMEQEVLFDAYRLNVRLNSVLAECATDPYLTLVKQLITSVINLPLNEYDYNHPVNFQALKEDIALAYEWLDLRFQPNKKRIAKWRALRRQNRARVAFYSRTPSLSDKIKAAVALKDYSAARELIQGTHRIYPRNSNNRLWRSNYFRPANLWNYLNGKNKFIGRTTFRLFSFLFTYPSRTMPEIKSHLLIAFLTDFAALEKERGKLSTEEGEIRQCIVNAWLPKLSLRDVLDEFAERERKGNLSANHAKVRRDLLQQYLVGSSLREIAGVCEKEKHAGLIFSNRLSQAIISQKLTNLYANNTTTPVDDAKLLLTFLNLQAFQKHCSSVPVMRFKDQISIVVANIEKVDEQLSEMKQVASKLDNIVPNLKLVQEIDNLPEVVTKFVAEHVLCTGANGDKVVWRKVEFRRCRKLEELLYNYYVKYVDEQRSLNIKMLEAILANSDELAEKAPDILQSVPDLLVKCGRFGAQSAKVVMPLVREKPELLTITTGEQCLSLLNYAGLLLDERESFSNPGFHDEKLEFIGFLRDKVQEYIASPLPTMEAGDDEVASQYSVASGVVEHSGDLSSNARMLRLLCANASHAGDVGVEGEQTPDDVLSLSLHSLDSAEGDELSSPVGFDDEMDPAPDGFAAVIS